VVTETQRRQSHHGGDCAGHRDDGGGQRIGRCLDGREGGAGFAAWRAGRNLVLYLLACRISGIFSIFIVSCFLLFNLTYFTF
jgi:hypothetical protein